MSNTNGISSACVDLRIPPNTGLSHVKRYIHAGAEKDGMLVVREGFVEATETRGLDWLGERLDEVLGKAAA